MARDADDGGGRTMPNHDTRTISNKPLLFYKLMVASIVHDDKLKIPGKVAKRIEQELSIVVTVSVPDGRKWNMRLGKGGGKCWFGDGWVEFMKYYNVRVGYLLVFRYKGDSMFVVNIFNLSNAEIQYLTDSGGAAESKEERKCSMSKGKNQCGTVDERKKFDSNSVAFKEDKPCVLALLANGKKSENEGNKKLDSSQVSVDEVCSVTGGKECANDSTQKMPYLAPQGFTADASQTQNKSGVISELLQSKLAEMNDEILFQIKNANGGFEETQQDKQCSLNESQNLGTDITINMLVPELKLQGKQCSVNENKESVNDITLKESSFRNLDDENLCSLTKRTESSNNDTQKKSGVTHPGFVKPAKQTPGNEKSASSGGARSPSSSLLVKDVTPGYYRANIMSLDNKKPKMKKRKIPPPATATNDGSGLIADKLNSLGKMELTPDKHIISKTAINVPTANSLTTAARSGASSHMGTIADGDDKESTMIMNKLPGSELNLQTPVKRRQEKNIADLLNNTGTIKVLTGQKADIIPADVLEGNEQKKQKTMQLSAISNPPINPFCMVPMRVSYVQKKGLLNIPYNFASKYLQKTSGFATLQNLEGNQWTVRLICNSLGRVKFSQGWYKFAMDNYLKEGDMCLFELLDSVNTLFIVTFIRSPKVPPPADPEVLKL